MAQTRRPVSFSNPLLSQRRKAARKPGSLVSLALLAFACCLIARAEAPSRQNQSSSAPAPQAEGQTPRVTTADQAIDLIIARERQEIATLRRFTPIIETYTQEVKNDKDKGVFITKDNYYLGQADLSKEIVDRSMLIRKRANPDSLNPLAHVSGYFALEYVPEDFLRLIFVDRENLDRQHYQFEYVRREFLGEVRCVVFDVTPLQAGAGHFKGRIWAEDQNYSIVRFNGLLTPTEKNDKFNPHFESWRANVQPNLWLPSSVYSQDSELKDFARSHVTIKSQTRLWGYDLKNASRQQEFSDLTVEAPNAVDQAAQEQRDTSPLEAERHWREQAEVNVIDRLQRIGLLAPPGQMDKVLETVVNNLEVTNNLDIQPEIRCRVLLTATMESFSLAHTIVMSRGLLDVLPDEASLATMLAQELAAMIVTPPQIDNYAFSDATNVPALEALGRFSFRYTPGDVQLASQKALELLKHSPYKDKLGTAGLFLKQLDSQQKALPALINPRLGNRVVFANELMAAAPPLQPEQLNQIAALPIGSRVKLDPWSDQVELLKAKPVTPLSVREKMPFELTPFMPYLTRYRPSAPPAPPAPSGQPAAPKQETTPPSRP